MIKQGISTRLYEYWINGDGKTNSGILHEKHNPFSAWNAHPFQSNHPINSENDERKGVLNWQCLDSRSKPTPKSTPNIQRGIACVSFRPFHQPFFHPPFSLPLFLYFSRCFTALPLLTSPSPLNAFLFCIGFFRISQPRNFTKGGIRIFRDSWIFNRWNF